MKEYVIVLDFYHFTQLIPLLERADHDSDPTFSFTFHLCERVKVQLRSVPSRYQKQRKVSAALVGVGGGSSKLAKAGLPRTSFYTGSLGTLVPNLPTGSDKMCVSRPATTVAGRDTFV
jgi:hypothetical protein